MVNIEKLKNRGAQKKKELKKFLKRVEKNPPRGLLKTNAELTAQTWNEIDCLSCANCCKKMTPTFKKVEVKRIAEHIGMTYTEYFEKYLPTKRFGNAEEVAKVVAFLCSEHSSFMAGAIVDVHGGSR